MYINVHLNVYNKIYKINWIVFPGIKCHRIENRRLSPLVYIQNRKEKKKKERHFCFGHIVLTELDMGQSKSCITLIRMDTT